MPTPRGPGPGTGCRIVALSNPALLRGQGLPALLYPGLAARCLGLRLGSSLFRAARTRTAWRRRNVVPCLNPRRDLEDARRSLALQECDVPEDARQSLALQKPPPTGVKPPLPSLDFADSAFPLNPVVPWVSALPSPTQPAVGQRRDAVVVTRHGRDAAQVRR